MKPKLSHSTRGGTVMSCLLAFVLFFGGIGLYYFHYGRNAALEDPLSNLTYTQNTSLVQLNSFRKSAVARVCDSTSQQLERVRQLRKSTAKGTKEPTGFGQDCTEVKTRLREIVYDARLKTVPKKFKPRYSDGLMGIHYTYRSLVSLEQSVQADTKAERDKHYKESVRLSDKAKTKLEQSREYFASKDWAN